MVADCSFAVECKIGCVVDKFAEAYFMCIRFVINLCILLSLAD